MGLGYAGIPPLAWTCDRQNREAPRTVPPSEGEPMRRRRLPIIVALFAAALGWSVVPADCDTTAPALTAFGFTPNAINTTAVAQTVTCTMTLTAALSGVASATCSFTSPDLLHQQSC